MRKKPIIEWLILLAFLSVLTLPLIRLTASYQSATETAQPSSPQEQWMVFAEARFVHESIYFELEQDGKQLWRKGSQTGTEFEHQFSIVVENKTCELLLHIHWPDHIGETAVELILEPDARERKTIPFGVKRI